MYQDSLSTVSVKMLVKRFAILTVEEMTEMGGLSEQEAKEKTLPRPEGQVSEKRHSNKQSVFHTGISGCSLKTRS